MALNLIWSRLHEVKQSPPMIESSLSRFRVFFLYNILNRRYLVSVIDAVMAGSGRHQRDELAESEPEI